jgi:hypothetical protein
MMAGIAVERMTSPRLNDNLVRAIRGLEKKDGSFEATPASTAAAGPA